jgi:phosphonate transport system substrate-binding protein
MPDLEILATPVTHQGTRYSGSILVRTDSGIESIEQLRGRPFCFVKRGSTSGWLMPRRELRNAGLDPDVDLGSIHYGQQHPATLKLLDKGACAGAAVFTSAWHDADRQRMSPDSFRPLATYTMPHDAYVVRGTLGDAEVATLRAALLALEPGGARASSVLEHHEDAIGFARATDTDYAGIRAAVEQEPSER